MVSWMRSRWAVFFDQKSIFSNVRPFVWLNFFLPRLLGISGVDPVPFR
jgi:hypothetical protein